MQETKPHTCSGISITLPKCPGQGIPTVIHSATIRAFLSQPRKLRVSFRPAALASHSDHSLHRYPAGAQSREKSEVGEGGTERLHFSGPGGGPLGTRELALCLLHVVTTGALPWTDLKGREGIQGILLPPTLALNSALQERGGMGPLSSFLRQDPRSF